MNSQEKKQYLIELIFSAIRDGDDAAVLRRLMAEYDRLGEDDDSGSGVAVKPVPDPVSTSAYSYGRFDRRYEHLAVIDAETNPACTTFPPSLVSHTHWDCHTIRPRETQC
jgi:hypothetical protein